MMSSVVKVSEPGRPTSGEIMTMPGLPAAEGIYVDESGDIEGLF